MKQEFKIVQENFIESDPNGKYFIQLAARFGPNLLGKKAGIRPDFQVCSVDQYSPDETHCGKLLRVTGLTGCLLMYTVTYRTDNIDHLENPRRYAEIFTHNIKLMLACGDINVSGG